MDQACKNHPNRFCYICGHVVLPDCQAKVMDFVKMAYQVNFGVKLGEQEKPFAPHICCKTCAEIRGTRKRRVCHLVSQWYGGKGKMMLPTANFASQI